MKAENGSREAGEKSQPSIKDKELAAGEVFIKIRQFLNEFGKGLPLSLVIRELFTIAKPELFFLPVNIFRAQVGQSARECRHREIGESPSYEYAIIVYKVYNKIRRKHEI